MTGRAFDVVVIGGGLAGLTAANRCAEHGLRVAILEAGTEERYLCNSRIAMGIFNVAMRDMSEGPAAMRATIDRVTAGEANPALADALVNNVDTALAWLTRHGVRTVVGHWKTGPKTMLVPPAAIGGGLRWPGRGPDQMLRRLDAAFVASGGVIIRGTRARDLIVEDRRVTGIVAEQAGASVTFTASAVVIADGGFQANPDLLREHVTPGPDRVLTRNAGTARGDGLRMALAIGAKTSDLRRFYGHVQSVDAQSNPKLWPYPTLDIPIAHGMIVDEQGQRFTDEGLGGVAVTNAIARRADPIGTVAIFDNAIWMGPATDWPLPANPLLANASATVHLGNTIEELATRAKLPPDSLKATIASYNAAVAAGTTRQLDPPRSVLAFKPMPIATAPFFAVPVMAGLTYTMGGIAIDASARVQHRDGGTIDGLYAAGSATGGHEGGPNAGYTGGLTKALTFGWLAGNAIAARLRNSLAA